MHMDVGNLSTHLEENDPMTFASNFSAQGGISCHCWDVAWLVLLPVTEVAVNSQHACPSSVSYLLSALPFAVFPDRRRAV